jgi:cytochrome c biogenesis protein CcmG, thiol:disulfide interchange protein DsbE
LPVLLFIALAVALAVGLTRDPSVLDSALLGEPVPEFSLPPLQGRERGLSSGDLEGDVSLVNVWASWCVPCRREKPLFLRLKEQGIVPIHGINYKDDPEQAVRFLETHGDAYERIGADLNGRVAIDWGVYGVPETFVIDRGRIVHRHVGELTPQVLEATILPLVRQRQEQ